ncbi:hypothetical protein E1B28_009151 [Marasmius oreades]|uniref:Uncharacterized protein n=1 Tax=Marasmius oreades TaxID=181124 RepID=A0A9P7UU09_9AGAR|nr:uncharacterized protein E1B28_009151 [Marasmius oreades]KAG7092836.1 hypothetical protein E1B28_009151 [Marasmius oreades]
MDILTQTIRKEGFFALYKGMASPLIGIAGVNSLLFASYGVSKRIISPFPQLTLPETALAGSMAGAANAILASPVEMFKVRMQGQYGDASDKRLRTVAREMWSQWGFRKGVMRGYWVTVLREIPAYAGFYTGIDCSCFKGAKCEDSFQLTKSPNASSQRCTGKISQYGLFLRVDLPAELLTGYHVILWM